MNAIQYFPAFTADRETMFDGLAGIVAAFSAGSDIPCIGTVAKFTFSTEFMAAWNFTLAAMAAYLIFRQSMVLR